ncbi:MAG: alpha/beta fold hydrolase [Longimicrobiales bacterium]
MEEKSTAAILRTIFEARPYQPAGWLPSPHGQTIAGRYLRRHPPVPFRRERVDTPDGDFLDLDFAPASDLPGDAPLVLLLHGLEGSARRGYAIETYHALAQRGVRGVGLNFRSCSGEINRAARFYHSGDTGDIRLVARLLRARFPEAILGAIGFSLGGNALLKFLGEEGAAAPFAAAVAVSVPYDLSAGADALDSSFMGRLYTRAFVKSLLAKAETKRVQLDGVCDIERIRNATSFRDFDDAATAPLHGFDGAEDYYARSSSAGFITSIRVPVLLLHAADDPFLPPSAFPRAAIAANPMVTAVVTPKGGHVGFIEGSPWRPRFWAEEQAAAFLAVQLTVPRPLR